MFNISSAECSCELFTGFDLCKHFQKPDVVKRLHTHDYQRVYAIIATITAFLGILGNLLVIFVSESRRRRISSNFNKLIRLLAFYDLTFAVFQFVTVIPKFWTPKWLYGGFLCSVFRSVEFLSTNLAVGVILAISIERYLKIFHPLYNLTARQLDIFMICVFIFAFSSIAPLLVHFKISDLETCHLSWPHQHLDSTIYDVVIFVIFYVIPLLVVTTLYAIIIRYSRLRNSSKSRTGSNQMMVHNQNQDNKRVIFSMLSVVVLFVLFVFPRHIVSIYFDAQGWKEYIFADDMDVDTFYALMYIAHIPYFFHVCANPLIYSATDSRWREELKGLLLKIKGEGEQQRNKQIVDMATYNTTFNQQNSEVTRSHNDEGENLV